MHRELLFRNSQVERAGEALPAPLFFPTVPSRDLEQIKLAGFLAGVSLTS